MACSHRGITSHENVLEQPGRWLLSLRDHLDRKAFGIRLSHFIGATGCRVTFDETEKLLAVKDPMGSGAYH